MSKADTPASSVTIPLTTPIQWHRDLVREIVLREPTWDDIMPIGHPVTLHSSPEGVQIPVENPAAIMHYAERCVVEPMDMNFLSQLGLRDTMRVRQAILDFFLSAGPGDAA
ncbi:hypothetical protein [Methylobacterium sp. SyP6R]|uniref:hypothetical protein n=1 Tax=Methylobacterium sp. SyP6R TaxID=2718876 RepID=UPI001F199BF7|nr:hypothetical protein [Methylobacterium sp. SyP6R]MCF4130255.1 hypothetical protein [Methylobacterium sp. SyP6R]